MALVRGTVTSYDAAAHAVCVALEGAGGTLADVPVLAQIPAEDCAPGRRVVVQIWPDVGAVLLGAYPPAA